MTAETREALGAGQLTPALDLLKRFISNPEERVRFKVCVCVGGCVCVCVGGCGCVHAFVKP